MNTFNKSMCHEPERPDPDRTLDRTACPDPSPDCGDPSMGRAGVSACPMRPTCIPRGKGAPDSGKSTGEGGNPLQKGGDGDRIPESPSRSRKSGSSFPFSGMGREGFLALGGAVTLLVFLLGAGFGLTMIHIRAIAQRQITLDRCAGGAAHLLRHLLNDLSASYRRIEAARLATLPLLATPSGPMALELFGKLITVESVIQRAIKTAWTERRIRWNTFPGLGCGLRNQPFRGAFPDFDFKVLSPGATVFEAETTASLLALPKEIRLGIRVAKLETEALIQAEKHHEWSVRWSR